MTATIISNATIVTCDPARTVLYDSALAITGQHIASIGPTDDVLASYPNVQVVNGRGKAVFPGLINCHAHLTANLFRGIAEDFGFPSSFSFPEDVREMVSDEETEIMALLGAIECARTGCTTTVEISAGIDRYAQALADTGMRWVLAESTGDGVVPPTFRAGEAVHSYSDSLRDKGMDQATRLFEKWNGKEMDRITCMGATSLVETSSPALLKDVRSLAEKHDSGYTIHLNQSQLEVESLMLMRGVRPTQSLFYNEYLGPGLLAAHCRFLDPSEISLLGTTRSNIAHQPAMAARRAVIPPIPALRDAGCTIGMGTDNNTQDMVEVMRTGLFTERILRQDGTTPQPEDVLQMTTMGSAKAIGMSDSIGSLEVGKKADLFVLNTLRSNLVPTMRIVSAFVHNGQPSDIEAVMVDGEYVMRDGKVLNVDEDAIIEEADAIGRRVWHELVSRYPNVPFPVSLAP